MIFLLLLAIFVVTTIFDIGIDGGWFLGPMDTIYHTSNSYDGSKVSAEPAVVAAIVVLWPKRILSSLLRV